jgi:hypothetical protein
MPVSGLRSGIEAEGPPGERFVDLPKDSFLPQLLLGTGKSLFISRLYSVERFEGVKRREGVR